MKIIKIINNNIISSIDNKDREVVVMGRGIGFGMKVNQNIEESKIEKIFRMENEDETKRLQNLLVDIPLERIQLVNQIINQAKSIIVNKLHKNVYITLIDHINFVIEHYKKQVQFRNPLLMEIRRYYPNEYKAGLMAVTLINEVFSLELSDDEAASIAMHFINAELGIEMPETMDMAKIIQNIIKIIENYFRALIDKNTIDYERFITHIKFLAQRIVRKMHLKIGDKHLNSVIRFEYQKEYKCSTIIRQYIEDEYGETITDDEITFLTIHIKRITMN